MPNSQNRSNGKPGIVQSKRKTTKASNQQTYTEGENVKHTGSAKDPKSGKDSERSSNQGRKRASGGSPNE